VNIHTRSTLVLMFLATALIGVIGPPGSASAQESTVDPPVPIPRNPSGMMS
jgi:hypothetical protein